MPAAAIQRSANAFLEMRVDCRGRQVMLRTFLRRDPFPPCFRRTVLDEILRLGWRQHPVYYLAPVGCALRKCAMPICSVPSAAFRKGTCRLKRNHSGVRAITRQVQKRLRFRKINADLCLTGAVPRLKRPGQYCPGRFRIQNSQFIA